MRATQRRRRRSPRLPQAVSGARGDARRGHAAMLTRGYEVLRGMTVRMPGPGGALEEGPGLYGGTGGQQQDECVQVTCSLIQQQSPRLSPLSVCLKRNKSERFAPCHLYT
jgi:hypothetical protein